MNVDSKKYQQLRVSVIIPCLNEGNALARCLRQPALEHADEIIIADAGGNNDSLRPLSYGSPMRVKSPPGRACQMNAASRCATGEILLFLHVDSLLPLEAIDQVKLAMSQNYAVGCFQRRFQPDSRLLSVTSKLANLRAQLTFWTFGDQTIFIKRTHFQQIGGYRQMKRFEDLDLCLRASQNCQHKVIKQTVITSSRRFKKAPIRQLLKDALLTCAFLTGTINQ